jgi:lysophospholipase L1-like esterase
MFLYVNGCSMTYGYELVDDPVTHECLDHDYRLKNSWPGLLTQKLGFEGLHNDSVPGGSNDRVLRVTLEWLLTHWIGPGKDPAGLFVVIGWSDAMRREFYVGGAYRHLIPHHDYPDRAVDELNKVYRRHAWSEYESAKRFATQILSLQAVLRLYRIPYLFFDAITPFGVTAEGARGEVDVHRAQIDEKRYFLLRQQDSLCTVLRREMPQWKLRHPDEAGHARWAQQLADYIEREGLRHVQGVVAQAR